MRRFQTRLGSATTREAPLRYPRIHLLGRQAVEAIFFRFWTRATVAGEQPAFEPRQRLGIADEDPARQACSPATSRLCGVIV